MLPEADNLPTFAQGSILVSREYAIPYHMGYYRPFRQRAIDLITAQYSPEIAVVTQFIRKYDLTFWLWSEAIFSPEYLHDNNWIRQHQPFAQNAIAGLRAGKIPAVLNYQDRCTVFAEGNYRVIAADCILELAE